MQSVGVDLAAHAPRWVATALGRHAGAQQPPSTLKRNVFALFADVADFSGQTRKFALRGARGAEDLAALLNGCFSLLVEIIYAHRGDIIAFAGDGICAVWEESDVGAAGLLSVNCALALQHALRDWALSSEQDLRLRISIEAGEAFFSCVGGLEGQWRYLVTGAPLRLACAHNRRAGPGEVILSPKARSIVGDLCVGEIVEGEFLRVRSVAAAIRDEAEPPRVSLASEVLERLLPKVVLERSNYGGGNWLAEFRNLSIVGVQLADHDHDAALLRILQEATFAIQTVSARFEGMVLDVIPSEKGVNAFITFGLPPLGHRDDALRAVEAAMDLRESLAGGGLTASIGVSTGRLFCGEYGGKARRQYSVLGEAMNLAARLMAVAGDEIVCDAATSASLRGRVRFASLGDVELKGWLAPVPIYRPEAVLSPREPASDFALIGREEERQSLSEALDRVGAGEGQFIVIEGEAGIGSSRLMADLMERAHSREYSVYFGVATAIERSTLYFAWREVVLQLIGVAVAATPASIHETLLERIADAPRLGEWAPLLDDVIHVGLPQSALTQGIAGAARASNIEELVVHLVKQSAAREPTLLAFDNLQWFDDGSAALLRAVARRAPEILVAATASSDAPSPVFPDEAATGVRFVKLDALTAPVVAELVRQRLGVNAAPPELCEFVHRHAGGNPFFCEELLLALRDTKAIVVDHGVCRVEGDLDAASRSALTASVEGAIVSRIDALPSAHQLALKIASAFGGEFSATQLQALYPDPLAVEPLRALLDRLTELDLLSRQQREGEAVFDFRHELIRRVTYDQMSFAQRRDLHREIADGIVSRQGDRLGPYHVQLARHRELGEQAELAIEHLDRAAEQALRNYANRDAIASTRKAMDLARSAGVAVDERRRAAWESRLGDACHEMHEFEEASRHYQSVLDRLGFKVPTTPAQAARNLFGAALLQLGVRLRGRASPPRDAQEQADFQRAAHVYERLAEEYFYLNDPLRLLHGTLASLNLAERSGSTAETISGYNGLALGLGMSGLPRAARYYSDRAFRLARESGGRPEIARANLVAGVLASGLGEREQAVRFGLESEAAFRQLGDQARLQNGVVGRAFTHLMYGDMRQAREALEEMSGPDFKDANDTVHAWRICAWAVLDTIEGRAALTLLSELKSAASGQLAPADRLLCLGVLASAHKRRGERDAARDAAELGCASNKVS